MRFLKRRTRLALRVLVTLIVVASGLAIAATPAQAFYPTPGVNYRIKLPNTFYSYNECLNVRDRSTANGAVVQMYTCISDTNNLWKFEDAGIIYGRYVFRIKSSQTGKCLDVKDGRADPSPMQMWDCNGNWQQLFYFVEHPTYNNPTIVEIRPVYFTPEQWPYDMTASPNYGTDIHDLAPVYNYDKLRGYAYDSYQAWQIEYYSG